MHDAAALQPCYGANNASFNAFSSATVSIYLPNCTPHTTEQWPFKDTMLYKFVITADAITNSRLQMMQDAGFNLNLVSASKKNH